MKGVMSRLKTTPAQPSYASRHAEPVSTAPKAAPVAKAAPAGKASGTPMKGGKTFVSKSDLETYRSNVGNKNATLGQYMNDLKGKTAVAGGKNDPAQIQKRLGSSEKAFDPTTSTGQYGGPKSTPAAKAPDVAKPEPAPTPAAAPKPIQNPDQERTKVAPPLPSMAQQGGGASNDAASGAAKMNAMPKAPTPGLTGSVTTKDASVRTKNPSSMVAESYTVVGDNKYRIV